MNDYQTQPERATRVFSNILDIPLFAGTPPLHRPEDDALTERVQTDSDYCTRVTDVATPSVSFYPATGNTPHPCVVVCPGGGYSILAYNHEGTDVAKWLNNIGISALVLKYRCPNRRDQALVDARRAVRFARAHANEWNLDPNLIGVLGFSAGANLAIRTSCAVDPDYEHTDEIDSLSYLPNFAFIIYPAYVYCEGWTANPELDITAEKVPPTFLIQSQDDPYWQHSFAYAIALRAAGVPFEMHVYPDGGHGWGMPRWGHSSDCWTKQAEAWFFRNITKGNVKFL